MSSTDYEYASSYSRPCHGHQRHHTVTASPVPAYVNRSVPTYSLTGQEQVSRPHPASPRFSLNVQPWKRQQPQSSLSFVPSTSPRLEEAEYTLSQPRRTTDRSTACISPFRSVRRMKEPFQLRLHASPSIETSPATVRELRLASRPPEIRTLRAWRSDQNLMASSLEPFGLLPSPPLSDLQPSQASPASTYFSSKPGSEIGHDGETEDCTCLPERAPCNRCTPQTPATDVSVEDQTTDATNVHMAHSNFVRQCELGNGQFTPAATNSGCMSPPATCLDVDSVGKRNFPGSSAGTHRSRSGTVSSEGSWVPSSLSYCETWLQGAPMDSPSIETGKSMVSNRRKFQIVQQSPDAVDWKRAHNDAVLAVKSKAKPKLVDISRQSSPATSYSLPTPPTQTIPATPDHNLPEVSAFSPDTPLEICDGGYTSEKSAYASKGHVHDREDAYKVSGSVNSESPTETVVCHQAVENGDNPETQQDPDPEAQTAPSARIQASLSASTKSDKEELEKWWDHEWTIDQLEHSVKDFPQNILRLTSPVVMFLRHNHERALLRPLRTIFPNAPLSLLDSLCAVLIAKNYLTSLSSLSRKSVNIPSRAQTSRLDIVPEKATSILGMKFAQPPPSRIRDQVLGSRSNKLHEDLDRIVDNLLLTIRGSPDEDLKSAVLVLIQVLETKA
ncbi:uncharacterized protein BDV17DRAFT_201811 [Aspergillus undulatus]|uniref:uncharacterized protein n=1 Tax=Aspergillus undulatus TaxID=1810928 RepID=UPI003CCE45E2